MKAPFLKTCVLSLFFASVPTWCSGQVLHSSVVPTVVVNWDSLGVHSSVVPTQWIGSSTRDEDAHQKQASLKKPNISFVPYISQEAKDEAMLPFQTGKASYYSPKMHGRKMADGTAYDREAFVAAHRTLPFGTMVRVVNKKNGKETVVRIADRGPFGHGRVIDLSNKAAAAIGMISDGVAPVELFVVSRP